MLILPKLVWLMNKLGFGLAMSIPSSLLRYITFKLTVDLAQIPALNQLAKAAMQAMLSGDMSQWDQAIQMPHYNYRSMPAISFHTGEKF